MDMAVIVAIAGSLCTSAYFIGKASNISSPSGEARIRKTVDYTDEAVKDYSYQDAPGIQEGTYRASATSEDPVAILKVRLAKGEITQEQYQDLLKTIT